MAWSICDELLSTGKCRKNICRADHGIPTCDLCRLGFPSVDAYIIHLSQQVHKDARQAQSTDWIFCYLCDSHHLCQAMFDDHIISSHHVRRARVAGVDPNIPRRRQSDVVQGDRHKDALQAQTTDWISCYLCDSHHLCQATFDDHIVSPFHVRRAKQAGVDPNIPGQHQSDVPPGDRHKDVIQAQATNWISCDLCDSHHLCQATFDAHIKSSFHVRQAKMGKKAKKAKKAGVDPNITGRRQLDVVPGDRHKDVLQAQTTDWISCYLCDSHHLCQATFDDHIKSSLHIRQAKKAGVDPNIPGQHQSNVAPSDVVPGHRLCTFCNEQISEQAWHRHVATAKHKIKELLASYTAALEQAERDKHGVTVNGDLDFKVVKIATARKGVRIYARIKTTVPSADIKLISSQLASSKGMQGKVIPTPCVITLKPL